MEFLSQRMAQVVDEVIRALKDLRDACSETLRAAAEQLFPAPAPVPVDNRPRPARSRSNR
jgi:hypothetical protein